MIINVVIFVAQQTPGIGEYIHAFFALYPIQSGVGIFPADPYQFYPWQFISYMFMHGGIGHIFFNLFALWIFGVAIENTWGTKTFVKYYFFTGIGAAILHMAINIGADPVMTAAGPYFIPTVGASGAVFGILLAFGMMFPNREIYFLLIPFPIKAKYFVIMYGCFELFMGISSLQTGIAHFAHLGGMLAGFILIRAWKLPTNLY